MKIKPTSWHYKLYMFGYNGDLIRYGDNSNWSDYRNGCISKEEYDNIELISHIPKDLCTYCRYIAQTLFLTILVCAVSVALSFILSSIMLAPFIGLMFGFDTPITIHTPIFILVILGLGGLLQKWVKYRRAQRYAASLLSEEEKEEQWYDIVDVYYSSIKQKMCVKLEVNPKDFE